MSGQVQPNYNHIHRAESLPRAKRTESHIIVRGYAVGMAGQLPQMWVFFDQLEPALVFGRAGRMSGYDISGYGVYEAAREIRYDARRSEDVTTLHVGPNTNPSLGHPSDEADAFHRWIQGCDPDWSSFRPVAIHSERYPRSVSVIGGTGLTPPTF